MSSESYRTRWEMKQRVIKLKRKGKATLALNVFLSTVALVLVLCYCYNTIGPGKMMGNVVLFGCFGWFISLIPGFAIQWDCERHAKYLERFLAGRL